MGQKRVYANAEMILLFDDYYLNKNNFNSQVETICYGLHLQHYKMNCVFDCVCCPFRPLAFHHPLSAIAFFFAIRLLV